MRAGIALALLSNRTFVTQPYMSRVFDIELLANIAPGLVGRYKQLKHLCPYHVNYQVEAFCDSIRRPGFLGGCTWLLKDPSYLPRFNHVAGNHSIKPDAEKLFRTEIFKEIKGFNFDAVFYRNFFFVPRIRSAAAAFIEQNFGDRDFAAVHLCGLEGSCKRRTNAVSPGAARFVCGTHRTTFLRPMNEMTSLSVAMPIFVASDRQNQAALNSYVEAGDKIVTGCKADCPFIDFEIATQASFFMGTLASTISGVLIRDWRAYRRLRAGAHYFPTVVNYREKKASLLGKFALGPGGHSWRV